MKEAEERYVMLYSFGAPFEKTENRTDSILSQIVTGIDTRVAAKTI